MLATMVGQRIKNLCNNNNNNTNNNKNNNNNNKSVMMKSYQLFRFSKRFYKETEKTLLLLSMRIEKLGLCFTTGCFVKRFKMIIIFSSVGLFVHIIFICFASSFASQLSDDARNFKKGKWEKEISGTDKSQNLFQK